MFSIFANHSQNKPLENITLFELHRQLIQPDREPFASTVNMIQRLRATNDEKTEKLIKSGLLCFTPAAMVDSKQANATPDQRNIKLSGFMQIDIDLQDNPNLTNAAEFRDKLAKVPYIALTAISARGRGVWALIKLKEPEKFDHYRDQVSDYFKQARITIDKSKSKNLTELRYFAPDSRAVLNNKYELFPLVAIKKKVTPHTANRATGASLSDLMQWVNTTTGYCFEDGQKHNFIYWLSYAIRKNGATEAEVHETIYSNVLSEELIHSNCISSGITHANNKGLYVPTEAQSKPQTNPIRYGAKLPATATNTMQYAPIGTSQAVRRNRLGSDGVLMNYYPDLPELID